jgi:phosphoenolpyruvate synthase/pyruvate phosphate dikinase
MRWEEIWDASLRIRNLFLNGRFPDQLASQIRQYVERHFVGKTMAVRSSAPDEDSGHTSFAGLHESYLDIRGMEQLFDHIKKVWASLWNDRALLYRQELGLDARQSRMAVVIQDMIDSDKSGIVFSQHPDQPGQMVIESVYGFNQGLVDGEIEPDRWIVDRKNGSVLSLSEANQPRQAILREEHGLHKQEVVGSQAARPPLSNDELAAVGNLALDLEKYFGCPQDCEWTFSNGKLIVLQSRPVTSLAVGDQKDERSWYFSLHRSFGNHIKLQQEIEGTQLPAMAEEAKALEEIKLESMSDLELAAEVERRMAINQKWVDIYWQQFIPFAHGMRLF